MYNTYVEEGNKRYTQDTNLKQNLLNFSTILHQTFKLNSSMGIRAQTFPETNDLP